MCRTKRVECKYPNPVPRAIDQASADILNRLRAIGNTISIIENTVSTTASNLELFDQRLAKIEELFLNTNNANNTRGAETRNYSVGEFNPDPPSSYVSNRTSGGEE